MKRFYLSLLLVLCGFIPVSLAHNLSPSLLSISEDTAMNYQVVWKQPMLSGESEPELVFPQDCIKGATVFEQIGNARLQRFSLSCQSGLAGRTISVAKAELMLSSVMLQFDSIDGHMARCFLSASQAVCQLELVSTYQRFFDYVFSGLQHILAGIDHLFFLVCLVVMSQTVVRLMLNVLAFTLGHSVSLALAVLGFLPGFAWIEFAIAFSIFYMACQAMATLQTSSKVIPGSLTCVGFGLLHGIGFAGGLDLLNITGSELISLLVAFNLGIELGQLLFIVVFFALLNMLEKSLCRQRADLVTRLLIMFVGSASVFWMLTRIPF